MATEVRPLKDFDELANVDCKELPKANVTRLAKRGCKILVERNGSKVTLQKVQEPAPKVCKQTKLLLGSK